MSASPTQCLSWEWHLECIKAAREQALLDAVEAVKALPYVRPAYYGKGVLIHGAEPDFVRSDAVAAIQALGARVIDNADIREVSVNTDGSGTGHVLPDGYAPTDTVTSPRGHGWPGWRPS